MIRYPGNSLNGGIRIGKVFCYDGDDPSKFSLISEPSIVMATELTPKETVRFAQFPIEGFVVERGARDSHIAILSRTMDLPALSSIVRDDDWAGHTAILDGNGGVLIVDPDDQTLQFFRQALLDDQAREQEMLSAYREAPAQTASGKSMRVYANINHPDDIQHAMECGAEGVGNFKTEFIFLNAPSYPDEEQQFSTYRAMAEQMGDLKLVIRTLDIGVDKVPDYLDLPAEENPALGYRGIRICLDRPEIFLPQIRAILRASACSNVAIMYPMIISVEEVTDIKRIVTRAMNELRSEGIPFNPQIEQGIMVETPAAVLMSRELADLVDFFSIGTNDLTQYTLAVDRQNPLLGRLSDPYHPAIMRSIELVVHNAHDAGIWVSISGELGADLTMTSTFIDLGVDALTVAPSRLLALKKAIRETP